MPRYLLLIFCGLWALPTQAQVAPSDVTGCFVINIEAWPHADSLQHLPRPDFSSHQLRLTQEPLRFPGYEDAFVVEGITPRMAVFTYWKITPDGQVFLGHPLPMEGFDLLLTVQKEELAGKLRSFTDALEIGKPHEHAIPARLTRIACETE